MQYDLNRFAERNFAYIEDRKLRNKLAEQRLVELFFRERDEGFFIEVGANEPRQSSQTWHLERKGWRGVLIEPIPELYKELCSQRPRSVVVQAACGAPEQRGPGTLHVAEGLSRSTLDRNTVGLNVAFTRTETVEVRTLDDILKEIQPPPVDFVSIDVEGLQLNVLRGFSLDKYRPRLLLVEDHLHDLKTHRYLLQQHYRLVKRTARNNWYIPRTARFALSSGWERFVLWQKVYPRTPVRKLRIALRRAFVSPHP